MRAHRDPLLEHGNELVRALQVVARQTGETGVIVSMENDDAETLVYGRFHQREHRRPSPHGSVSRVRNVVRLAQRDEVTKEKECRAAPRRVADQTKHDVLMRSVSIDVLLQGFAETEGNAQFDRSTHFGRTSAGPLR